MGEVIVGFLCILFLMFIYQIIVLGVNLLLALAITAVLFVAALIISMVISTVIGKLEDAIGENSFFILVLMLIAVVVGIILVCSKIYAIK